MQDFEEKLNSLLSDPEAMKQIAQLAKSLSGKDEESTLQKSDDEETAFPFAQLLGGIDPALLRRLPSVLSQWNRPKSGQTLSFLQALKPFIREEKRAKISQAAQLAKLIHLAKLYLAQQEG